MELTTMEFNVGGPPKSDGLSLDRLDQIVRAVLKKRFPGDAERQTVLDRGIRLNFNCPFCGDGKDARKKRGNIYKDHLYFKCYNGGCEKYTDLLSLVDDFDCSDAITDDERVAVKLGIDESRRTSGASRMRGYEMNFDLLSGVDFSKILVPRADLMRACKLWEIHSTSPVGVYLIKRRQNIDMKFAWDNAKKRLFIFNTDKSGDWVFGMQTRQFGEAATQAKYKTYSCADIWSKFMRRNEAGFYEQVEKVDHLSTVFGVLKMDFGAMITVFEGPMDSFLMWNSAALCSIGNPWPFALENKRWMQDNDEAGRKKAMELITAGNSVFMWRKFLSENGIPSHKVKDLNDLRVYEWAKGVQFDDVLDDYFSSHHLDGIHV